MDRNPEEASLTTSSRSEQNDCANEVDAMTSKEVTATPMRHALRIALNPLHLGAEGTHAE